jgi:hypothetical protein
MNVSISRDGVEIGEWAEEEVRSFFKEGRLVPTDFYWKEGMSEWKELGGFIKPPPPFPKRVTVEAQEDVPSAVVAPPPLPAPGLTPKNWT